MSELKFGKRIRAVRKHDELVKYVSGLFSSMVEISTFAEWKKGERADINDNR